MSLNATFSLILLLANRDTDSSADMPIYFPCKDVSYSEQLMSIGHVSTEFECISYHGASDNRATYHKYTEEVKILKGCALHVIQMLLFVKSSDNPTIVYR